MSHAWSTAWFTEPLAAFIDDVGFEVIVTCLLGAILIALIVAITAFVLRKRSHTELAVSLLNDSALDELMTRVMSSVTHATDVSAVVEMVRQLDNDPDALELLNTYPRTVQAAAWVHYTNTLGAALQHAQDELMRAHKLPIDTYNYRASSIMAAQTLVDSIRRKLDQAIADSGQSRFRVID